MIFVIHDSRQPSRLINFSRELAGLDYEIVEPIWKPTVIESINATHKWCVQKAKDIGEPYVTIFEDDIYCTHPDSLMLFFSGMPEGEWYLYAAGSYHLERDKRKGAHLIQTHVVGLHAYRVNFKFYDEFLALPNNKHIDTALELTGKPIHILYPCCILQTPGWSANNQADVNYNIHLQPEDIWQ